MASNVDDTILKNLLTILECPLCFDIMQPPINQCKNGHLICGKCKPKIKECYVCRDGTLDIRSIVAETMATIAYPCCNKEHGCQESLPLSDIWQHEDICAHRQYECLVGEHEVSIIKCGWKGKRGDIFPHVMESHPGYLKNGKVLEVSGIVRDMSVGNRRCHLVTAFGEIFWFHTKRDPVQKKYYQALQYIGPHDNVSLFQYTHEFTTKFNNQTIIVKNTPLKDTEDVEAAYMNGNCLLIDYITLKFHMYDRNALSYRITFEKKD